MCPLVGVSLWATQCVSWAYSGSAYAFPRNNKTTTTNANSASTALNIWFHPYVPDGCAMHSFWRSMRDRLRAAEYPADIVDQIGGGATRGIGQGYGFGYDLEVCYRFANRSSNTVHTTLLFWVPRYLTNALDNIDKQDEHTTSDL